MRLRLLITESAAYEDVDLTLLKRVFEVHLMSSGDTDLERRIRDVQPNILLVGLGMTVGHTEIGAAQHLQLVVSPTTGSDHLDTELLQTRGIDILTLRDRQFVLEKVSSTAELAWGLLLTVARQIGRATESVSKGEWQRQRFMGMQPNPVTALIAEGFNVVATPHIGGYTHEAVRFTGRLVIDALINRFSLTEQ
jgi:D-3-phosphoglycerate dehydrogenase